MLSRLIRIIGFLVAAVMAIGAVAAALNTMYSAVAARAREVATLQAIGFRPGSIVLSFLTESLLISLAGGVLGCLVSLPVHGRAVSTLNWQTMSNVAFAFRITPELVASALGFALLMGLVGGLFPAVRAARLPVVVALREL